MEYVRKLLDGEISYGEWDAALVQRGCDETPVDFATLTLELLTFSVTFAGDMLNKSHEVALENAAARLLLLSHYAAFVSEKSETDVINRATLMAAKPEGVA